MLLASLTSALTSLIGDHGLYAVFGLMLIDAVFPAASELVMLYAGVVASGAIVGQGVVLFGWRIDSPFWGFVAMSMAGTVGYTVGSLVGWGIGAYGGRPYLEKHGRWLHLGPDRLERAEHWFERYGDATVFIGRVTPVIRSFVSIPAGVARMPLVRYTVLTFFGCAIWCLAFAGAGWAAGANYERIHKDFRWVEYLVAVAVVALAVALYVRWRRASKLARRASDPPR